MFQQAVLMITGGTGSFGSAVLKRLLNTNIGEIRIFSRDEKKQEDLRNALNDPRVKFYIGDVRNQDSLLEASKGVDFIFHAAALKQVPSCEFYPMEAVRTNVLGTEHLIHAALANRVKKVVMLSTDKAVYPINAMGLSKALMEKLMVAKSRLCKAGETIFSATRYGNIIASRGSVIPLFISQIQQGQPLTVTDPNMTRFMMSLEDSVDLVLYALKHGGQGDIFVQKAPAATVGHLAQALKELLNSKSEILTIGTRHGEKLYESLLSREEIIRAEETECYYRIPADARDLNYKLFTLEGKPELSSLSDYTSHNTVRLNLVELKELLKNTNGLKELFSNPSRPFYSSEENVFC